MLVPEKNEIGLPALSPDGRPIPADEIRIRAGRLPKKSRKTVPSRGVAQTKIFQKIKTCLNQLDFIWLFRLEASFGAKKRALRHFLTSHLLSFFSIFQSVSWSDP